MLDNEQSERLVFRLLEDSDFESWCEFFKTPGVSKYLGMEGLGSYKEQCQEWFKLVKNRYENDSGGMNVLIDKSNGSFIGQCGLLIQEVDGVKELEIGYSIMPKYWGEGYATEAAKKCRDFAFEHGYADSLISIIHIENIQSEKVAIKNGMVKTKRTFFKNKPVNIFRITKDEWIELIRLE